MRLTAFLGFTAMLAASAHAECQRPVADVVIPEGATASEQALVAAAQKVRELEAKVGEYQSCLAGEASQKSVGKDETARQQILSEHAALHNAAVEELAMLAACSAGASSGVPQLRRRHGEQARRLLGLQGTAAEVQ